MISRERMRVENNRGGRGRGRVRKGKNMPPHSHCLFGKPYSDGQRL